MEGGKIKLVSRVVARRAARALFAALVAASLARSAATSSPAPAPSATPATRVPLSPATPTVAGDGDGLGWYSPGDGGPIFENAPASSSPPSRASANASEPAVVLFAAASTRSQPRTTVYVPIPELPADDAPAKLSWTLNDYRIPSPLIRDPSREYPARQYTYGEECGFMVLDARADVERTVVNLVLAGRATYSAAVAWFKVGNECLRPIYVQEYAECSVRNPFGVCGVKSAAWWDRAYSESGYMLVDRLRVALAAPPKSFGGLYTRVVVIQDTYTVSDVLIHYAAKECGFSLSEDPGDSACIPLTEFFDTTIVRAGMSPSLVRSQHEAMIQYRLKVAGGAVPQVISAASMRRDGDLPPDFWRSYLDPDKYDANATASWNGTDTSYDDYEGGWSPASTMASAPPSAPSPSPPPGGPTATTTSWSATTIASLVVAGLILLGLTMGAIAWCIKAADVGGGYGDSPAPRRRYGRRYERLEDAEEYL